MTTAGMMKYTILALLPGFAAYTWFFGAGVMMNVLLSVVLALIIEACILTLRAKPISADYTVILTGALLGLCLPPLIPFWMTALAISFAVVFGKHLYGGTGQNLFNPAMIGFAMLIVSFPLAMSYWPSINDQQSLKDVFDVKSTLTTHRELTDGLTAATPLDAYKFREAQTNEEFFGENNQANWQAWSIINLGFLVGGISLLILKIIPWQTPVALLSTLLILSLAFHDSGSSASLGSPAFHLFSGATMIAAFFIITDPVTCPGQAKGLLVFGAGVGLITFIIRTQGAYPEGIAFAVLLMNAAAPLIDHVLLSQERSK